MKVIVTCGPSYEPIDQVRRLTNFSSRELGVHLSNQLQLDLREQRDGQRERGGAGGCLIWWDRTWCQ